MRVLLNQECAAVAGGNQSECERNVELAGIATGAVVGGVAGGLAGGVGAVPGALAGAGAGSLVAQVVGPPLCRWSKNEESEDEESEDKEPDVKVGSASGHPFRPPSPPRSVFGDNSREESREPLQLVVNTAEY